MSTKSHCRKMPYTRILNSLIPRSKSDSSQNSLASIVDKRPRRGSDWSETMTILPNTDNEGANVVLRPLQLNNAEQPQQGSLYQRRLSKGLGLSKSSSNSDTSSREVTRSLSVKVPRRSDSRRRYRGSSIPSDVGSTYSRSHKVQERTNSNRSLPLPGEEYTRLRNFSTTSKSVINRGDSFRTKLSSRMSSVLSSRYEKATNEYKLVIESPIHQSEVLKSPMYKVLIIGVNDVGKTSLKNQFMTSEYICAYDSSHEEESDKAVTIVLNCEESQLEFEEETLFDENISSDHLGTPLPDAYVVVYSVANRRSFLRAKQLLYQINSRDVESRPVIILVGNKNDLARLRMVTTEEGRSLARVRCCKFIETSVAINHQVDELLVGILNQIRMKNELVEKKIKRRESQSKKSSSYSGCSASGVLKKILQRACLKSQSCDNLHVL